MSYVSESEKPPQLSEEYPLTGTEGECKNIPVYGYDYFSHHGSHKRRQGQGTLDYEFKFFAREEDLYERLSFGPIVSNIDVGPDFQFLSGGIYYNEDVCGNYENEHVPPECRTSDNGYTCLKDCKNIIPIHCNRQVTSCASN